MPPPGSGTSLHYHIILLQAQLGHASARHTIILSIIYGPFFSPPGHGFAHTQDHTLALAYPSARQLLFGSSNLRL